MTGVVLAAIDLTVVYRRGVVGLDRVSISVDEGSWLAVIGPNGAGKSTLLKALAGLVPHEGTITAGGRQLNGSGGDRARLVAYVAQRPVLPPGMTVAEYVLLGRASHLGWFASESARDRRIVAEVLERLALTPFAARQVTELSGGEVQRVALGRALAQQSPILALDEPTSALDIGHQVSVLELIDELRAEVGLTVVSAMHDLSAAGRFAHDLVLLDRGAVAASGPPARVLTESTLSRYYQTPVQVLAGADGGAVIVPLRHRNEPSP
jgi:iron complex transport system ATP-binding protein